MNICGNTAFKCKKCGRLTYPKRAVCLRCGNREFEQINPGEKCTLLTFTDIYQLPWGMNELFVTIGVCEFESGVKAMGRLTTSKVKIGDKMKASWKIIRQIQGEDAWGWVFEPLTKKH
jgi:uncharacterized OB-fold protein